MALIRWEPTREINTIQQEINRLFGTLLDQQGGEASAAGRRWIPAMDLVEHGEHYELRADLPGLSDQDVSIEVDGGVLTISGERGSEREARGEGYYRIERATGRFSRSLTLPDGVDPEQIEAHFDKGVLEIRIPKPEQSKPRRVQVRPGRGRPETIEGHSPGGGAGESAGEQTDGARQREHASA